MLLVSAYCSLLVVDCFSLVSPVVVMCCCVAVGIACCLLCVVADVSCLFVVRVFL